MLTRVDHSPSELSPCLLAQGSDCIFCISPKTNLCPKIRGTQGKGLMPDGSSRFTLKSDGSTIYHFMGCSTFAEYTVLAEISCAKVNPVLDPKRSCLFGCGVATGLGAVWNTAKVEPMSSVAVFGLGAVGFAVVQAAKAIGAHPIVGIDVNPKKFELAKKLGCTECINPKDHSKPLQQVLVAQSPTGFGYDYTFDCTGNTDVMRSALEAAHRGWGKLTIIGVAASGKEIATRPFQFITGRCCTGTACAPPTYPTARTACVSAPRECIAEDAALTCLASQLAAGRRAMRCQCSSRKLSRVRSRSSTLSRTSSTACKRRRRRWRRCTRAIACVPSSLIEHVTGERERVRERDRMPPRTLMRTPRAEVQVTFFWYIREQTLSHDVTWHARRNRGLSESI